MKKIFLFCMVLVWLNAQWFYKGELSKGNHVLVQNQNGKIKSAEVLSVNGSTAICIDENGNKINVEILENSKESVVIISAPKTIEKEISKHNANENNNKENTDNEKNSNEEKSKLETKVTTQESTQQPIIIQYTPTQTNTRPVVIEMNSNQLSKQRYTKSYKFSTNPLNFEMEYKYSWKNNDFMDDLDHRKNRHYRKKRIPKGHNLELNDYQNLLKQKNSYGAKKGDRRNHYDKFEHDRKPNSNHKPRSLKQNKEAQKEFMIK